MATPIRLPIRGADELGDAVRQTIRAFHGSPYDFDKFDASKIGTGEGAQAYGHGLYFAQNQSVAQEYKKNARMFRPNTDGKWSKRTVRDAEDSVAHAGSREEAIKHLSNLLESVAEDVSLRPQVEDAIAYLQNQKPPKPRVYEVEIAYPESAMLDLDAPVREQPEAIIRALRNLGLPDRPLTGREAYNTLVTKRQHQAAADSLRTNQPAPSIKHFERLITPQLREAGVPGAKYFDGDSRSAGEGTRNYVMFPGTEDQIRILRKYGLLAPMAAAGAMGEE